MKTYIVDLVRPIYDNTHNNTIPLTLNKELDISIEVDKEARLEYIDILFATYKKQPKGILSIKVDVEGIATNFVIDLLQVVDNAPIRLSFDDKPVVLKTITLHFNVQYASGKGPIAIWMNTSGPCVKIAAKVKEEISIENTPLISVVVPVYKPTLEHLKETIKSLLSQIYDNWELCLVDDGSNDSQIKTYLEKISYDTRIKVKINTENKGIACTSNEALMMATGEYVCFVDHDDTLEPDALLEIAKIINEHPNAKFIYTDEDKIIGKDQYVQPFFKPDWSYDMFLSQNYTCHLTTYLRSTVKNVGNFSKDYEGSQDYALALRIVETIQPEDIYHIPKILYHWRIVEGSTAGSIVNKPYAHLSAIRALKAHINRRLGRCFVYSDKFPGTYRVDYLVNHHKSINIIVPTSNNYTYFRTCITSISQSQYPGDFCITIIDNNNTDERVIEYLNSLQMNEYINIIKYDKPFNFSEMNNLAVDKYYDLTVFLNDDTELITPNWLELMAQNIGRNKVVAVGPKLLYPDGTIQHAGVIIGIGRVAGHSHKHLNKGNPGYFSRPHIKQNVSAVTGACMMVDTKTFLMVGGFNTDLPKAFNDVDLCLKFRELGYNIVYNPHVELFHHESVSRGLDNHKDPEFAKAVQYMIEKWDCPNYRDPYYNPNLTLDHENFALR